MLAQPAQRAAARGVAGGAIGALSAPTRAAAGPVAARLGLLLELLRERRCLLVLDNLETVLEPGAAAGALPGGV